MLVIQLIDYELASFLGLLDRNFAAVLKQNLFCPSSFKTSGNEVVAEDMVIAVCVNRQQLEGCEGMLPQDVHT